jgi:hypothetical protein
MDLDSFQRSFKNNEIVLKPYLLVVSILLSIIVIIMFFNNNIEDYYNTRATIKNNELKIIVDINNLSKVTDHNKIKIGKNIFTYNINKIDDYVINDNVYKEVTIHVKKYDNNLIDNNVVETNIIINNTNIIKYLFKTLKGE